MDSCRLCAREFSCGVQLKTANYNRSPQKVTSAHIKHPTFRTEDRCTHSATPARATHLVARCRSPAADHSALCRRVIPTDGAVVDDGRAEYEVPGVRSAEQDGGRDRQRGDGEDEQEDSIDDHRHLLPLALHRIAAFLFRQAEVVLFDRLLHLRQRPPEVALEVVAVSAQGAGGTGASDIRPADPRRDGGGASDGGGSGGGGRGEGRGRPSGQVRRRGRRRRRRRRSRGVVVGRGSDGGCVIGDDARRSGKERRRHDTAVLFRQDSLRHLELVGRRQLDVPVQLSWRHEVLVQTKINK